MDRQRSCLLHSLPQLLVLSECNRFMASEWRVVSQQLYWALELNWQFVILIGLTLLHLGRNIIRQGEAWRKSIHRLLFLCVSCYLLLHLFLTFASRLNALFSNPLAHTPFHFYTCGFVSHQWPSLLLSLQHTDILFCRDFHYQRSGTIYQGMDFSHLLWLTEGLWFYWVLHSTVSFLTTPGSYQTGSQHHTVVSLVPCGCKFLPPSWLLIQSLRWFHSCFTCFKSPHDLSQIQLSFHCNISYLGIFF